MVEVPFDASSLFSKPAKERLSGTRDKILNKLLVKKNPLQENEKPESIMDESDDFLEQAFEGE